MMLSKATLASTTQWVLAPAPRRAMALIVFSAMFALLIVLRHITILPATTRWNWPNEDCAALSQQQQLNETHSANDSTLIHQLPGQDALNWSQFAYTQYATNGEYLCNSVMLFGRLQVLGSRADRVLMYPSRMLPDPTVAEANTHEGQLLIKAREEYNVKLIPIEVQSRDTDDKTWAESFTKLLAFNQTQYTRVLSLDSDSLVLQSMDELFLLPPSPVAMPRAYWLYPEQNPLLASHIMVIEPSAAEFARIADYIAHNATDTDYDMEIANYLYQDSALVLPHRPYGLLTQEFCRARHDHVMYLGSEREEWDAMRVYQEAKYLHFSDWPVPKPWMKEGERLRKEREPRCAWMGAEEDGETGCVERDLWNGFYEEFGRRRERICNIVTLGG